MMDSMIERIAKAAAAEFERQAEAGDIKAFRYVDSTTTMDAGCQYIEGEVSIRSMARAVLNAMREPTIDMIISCGDIPWSQQDMWHRSIDAALAEDIPCPTA